MTQPIQLIPLPAPLVQAIASYLVKRPYHEVAELVGAMQNATNRPAAMPSNGATADTEPPPAPASEETPEAPAEEAN